MWQRFTPRAQKVIRHAAKEADLLGSPWVNTEHLLLGLILDEDSVANKVLLKLIDDPTCLRNEILKHANGRVTGMNEMTLAPRAKRVIDLAFTEARAFNAIYIGTEHLLLGLIRERDGLAGRVLEKYGIRLSDARKEVADVLGQGPPTSQRKPSESIWELVSKLFKRSHDRTDRTDRTD